MRRGQKHQSSHRVQYRWRSATIHVNRRRFGTSARCDLRAGRGSFRRGHVRVPITIAGTLSFRGRPKDDRLLYAVSFPGIYNAQTNTSVAGGLNEIRSSDDACTRLGVVMRAASNRGRGANNSVKNRKTVVRGGVLFFRRNQEIAREKKNEIPGAFISEPFKGT